MWLWSEELMFDIFKPYFEGLDKEMWSSVEVSSVILFAHSSNPGHHLNLKYSIDSNGTALNSI